MTTNLSLLHVLQLIGFVRIVDNRQCAERYLSYPVTRFLLCSCTKATAKVPVLRPALMFCSHQAELEPMRKAEASSAKVCLCSADDPTPYMTPPVAAHLLSQLDSVRCPQLDCNSGLVWYTPVVTKYHLLSVFLPSSHHTTILLRRVMPFCGST